MSFRDTLNSKPWIGWAVAGACLLIAVFFLLRSGDSGNPYSVERLSEMVLIRDTETGETWEMQRAQLELMLRERGGPIDPSVGIPNPKTGKPTGFPVDREWLETVERLNAERELTIRERQGGKPPPSGGQ